MSDFEPKHIRDPIATLLRSAPPGAAPDAARMERAMRKVHGEWHAALARRRRVRRLAFAAGFALFAVAAALILELMPARPTAVATITRVAGGAVVRHLEAGRVKVEPLRAGSVLMSGDEVDTDAGGRVLLSASSGEQLRLDRQSVSEWTSRNELRLTRGAVYVETARASSVRRSLIVSTQLGDVRHVGTRFEVRVADGETRVRVRDGEVSFAPTGGSLIAVDAGQQLVARGDTSVVGTGPASAAPEWHWTMDIAPSFTLEGRSAFDALEWLGHEAGLDVRYTTGGARAQARARTLGGSIDGLDAQSALRAVLAGSGLAFELYPDRIEVRSSDAG